MPDDYHIEDEVLNSNPRTGRLRLIVIHSTRSGRTTQADGSPWTPEDELAATIGWFQNAWAQASAHLVVAANGDWWYCVPWDRAAWHAGFLNQRSIGIELTQPTIENPFTDIQIARTAEAVRWLCNQFSIPPRHTKHDWQSGIIGHEETSQGRSYGKSDPGPLFPWEAFMGLVIST